jgi:hypothetical protein
MRWCCCWEGRRRRERRRKGAVKGMMVRTEQKMSGSSGSEEDP